MINKFVKSLAHVFKVRRLSGIADAMNLVPSKPITLPSVISPDEVLENNLAKEATSIYGSSQSSIIQIFGLFMKMFWGQTRLPAREHFLQGDVNRCSYSRTCQTKWSALSLSIWSRAEFASWCYKWANPRHWSGIKSGLRQFHWSDCAIMPFLQKMKMAVILLSFPPVSCLCNSVSKEKLEKLNLNKGSLKNMKNDHKINGSAMIISKLK